MEARQDLLTRPFRARGRGGRTRRAVLAAGLLLALLPLLALSRTPVVRSVSIDGAAAFSRREVLSWLGTAPDRPFQASVLSDDLRAIVGAYRRAGYLSCRAGIADSVVAPDTSWVVLAIRIEEGRRSVVGSLAVTGLEPADSASALAEFGTRPGQPLDTALLEEDIDAVLRRCEGQGRPFARGEIRRLAARPGGEEDSLDVELAFEPGPRVTIEEIRVEGNTETSAAVVVREARLRRGEPFDPDRVGAIRGRLMRLNIFASVAEPELYTRDSAGGLLIRVQEGRSNTFDGIIGYLPGAPGGAPGTLTGFVSVGMRNLFGTGRKFSFRWQRDDGSSQELAVRYTEPWLAGLPLSLTGGFFQRQQDSAYVRRVLDGTADALVSQEVSVGAVFGWESVIPSAGPAGGRVTRSATTSLGAVLAYDTRDDLLSPTRGVRFNVEYHYGRKRVTAPDSAGAPAQSSLQRYGTEALFFFPLFVRQVLAVRLQGRQVLGGYVEESDLVRFGGANSLRGYREGEFLASLVAWGGTEYRFLLSRRSFLFGFLDAGYYTRRAGEVRGAPAREEFLYGYGLGVRVETPLGNMGVSFALGKGDSFGTAKVHIGLVNEF